MVLNDENNSDMAIYAEVDKECAKRIKQSILQSLTYDDVENETGISTSTLKRLASGEREPKLRDIKAIAKATGKNPVWLAFGGFPNTGDSENTHDQPGNISDIELIQTGLITMIKNLDIQDALLIERIVSLLNLDRTINEIQSRQGMTKSMAMQIDALGLPRPGRER